jgi:hypothetical protein
MMFGRLWRLATFLSCAIAASSCRAPRLETDASPTEAGPANDPGPAAGVECRQILRRSWTAIQPALARLQVAPQPLEREYLGVLGDAFVTGCSSLRPAQRHCLAIARSPPLALETCGINRDRSPADRVLLPSLAAHITLLDPPALPPGAGARLLASLVGTWVNTGADGQINATWSFSADGRLQIRERKAGAESEQTFRVSFPARHRMALERAKDQIQLVTLFRSSQVLYVARGLSYAVVPLTDRSRITLRHDARYIFFEPRGCETVAEDGALFPASCGFEQRPDGSELFAVRYGVPPRSSTAVSYSVVDEHLIHEELASYGRFVRQGGFR